MKSPADSNVAASSTLRRFLPYAAIAFAVVAGSSYYALTSRPPSQTNVAGDTRAPTVVPEPARTTRSLPNSGSVARPRLPASLSGTDVPPLPIDRNGHLVKSQAVRFFFDYFLTTRHETTDAALERLVERELASRLEPGAPLDEANRLWHAYRAYLASLDSAQFAQLASEHNARTIDLDALASLVDQRARLADQHLGDWASAFFADEVQGQRYYLARLRIELDAHLDTASKQQRLDELEGTLPADERERHIAERAERQTFETLSSMRRQKQSVEAMTAFVAQTIGPDAAQRFEVSERADRAWQGKYDDYRARRQHIVAQGLSPADLETQITQLRRQSFPDETDARRAASFDTDH